MKKSSSGHASRRQALGMLGAAGVTAIVGCGDDGQTTSGATAGSGSGGATGTGGAPGVGGGGGAGGSGAVSCVVRPEHMEGPYFVDERLERSDIRADPSDGTVREGVSLRLVIRVYRTDGGACSPLSGAIVDIWQCDALGIYSDVVDINGLFDTTGQKFLRGYQVTDERGVVELVTVYPGWYPGRTVHIHFKIRTDPASQQGYELTSQLYMDEAITDQVHAQAPYNANGPRDTTNAQDALFQRGGGELMLELSHAEQGYVGTFDIALQMA